MARRVERRPDSCRRSSAIKDKYGYVSHVYSGCAGAKLVSSPPLSKLAPPKVGASTAARRDRRGGLTGLLGVLKNDKYTLQESNLRHKIMKNGSNSKMKKKKPWTYHWFLLAHIIYLTFLKKKTERREQKKKKKGWADCLCHQHDHSSTKRALIQH